MKKHCAFPVISGILYILLGIPILYFVYLLVDPLIDAASIMHFMCAVFTALVGGALIALGVCLIAQKTRAVVSCLFAITATLCATEIAVIVDSVFGIKMITPIIILPGVMLIGSVAATAVAGLIKNEVGKKLWMLHAVFYIPGCLTIVGYGILLAITTSILRQPEIMSYLYFTLCVICALALFTANLLSMRWLAYPNGKKSPAPTELPLDTNIPISIEA